MNLAIDLLTRIAVNDFSTVAENVRGQARAKCIAWDDPFFWMTNRILKMMQEAPIIPRNLPPEIGMDALSQCPDQGLQEAVFAEIQYLTVPCQGLDQKDRDSLLYCLRKSFAL